MAGFWVKTIRNLFRSCGLDLIQYPPPDFDQHTKNILTYVQDYTLTSPQRIYALCESVKYVVNHQIAGDIVECGVWKGGSMMAIARTLLELNNTQKSLWLYDTFEGMADPTDNDISVGGISAYKLLKNSKKEDSYSLWCYSPLESVQKAVFSTEYPKHKIHFIKGKVEDTIPNQAPEQIALLRLDTDWYESTKHELIHLFPRLSPGGVIIIDDYGYWQGARKATDEYFQDHKIPILLNRIDDTGRIAIKLANEIKTY